jgi:D-alanyl-D-alanine carboxypeptidase (penicillin-binding protein 5/6)
MGMSCHLYRFVKRYFPIFFCCFGVGAVHSKDLYTTPTIAAQALLLDLSTGQTLMEKNAHQRMAPSSMTKILTAYVLLEAVKNGELKLSDEISVSAHAAKKEGTKMFLIPNQLVNIEDLLKGIIVLSGNDACTAFAEHMSGSEEAFAQMMNEKAKEWGLKESHFMNASGLPDKDHYSTCHDLAEIAIKTLESFPDEYKKYYSLSSFSFNKITQPSKNTLLKSGFLDGVKTGQTEAGKFGMVASAVREGRRLLLVVNGVPTAQQRAEEVRRLMNWGFSFFESVVLFRKGDVVVSIPTWGGDPVNLVASQTIGLSLPKRVLRKSKIVLRYYSPLVAPIKKGQKLGVLWVQLPQGDPMEFNLVAEKDIDRTGMIQKILSWIHRLAP